MSLRYRHETLHIPFRDPFRIARELSTPPDQSVAGEGVFGSENGWPPGGHLHPDGLG